jgi:hypothetical protein
MRMNDASEMKSSLQIEVKRLVRIAKMTQRLRIRNENLLREVSEVLLEGPIE